MTRPAVPPIPPAASLPFPQRPSCEHADAAARPADPTIETPMSEML